MHKAAPHIPPVTEVRVNWKILRGPDSRLSNTGTDSKPEVLPSSMVTCTRVAAKSMLSTAATWSDGTVVLGATEATPNTWMSPIEP